MSWVLVQCSEHWKGNTLTGPISFSIRLTKKDKGAYNELVETIFQRTGVSRDQIQLKLTSHVETGVDKVTLSVMSDDDVVFVIMNKEKGWATIDVEFVKKHGFRPPPNPIQSEFTVSPVKPTDIPRSSGGTPNYKSVSGSNNPVASPGCTSLGNDQATPASTTKHAVMDRSVVDSSESIDSSGMSDSSKTSDTEDESGGDDDGGVAATVLVTEEQGLSGTPNSSSPSLNTRWTVSGSDLYSIPAVRSVDVFQNPGDQGPLYVGQMFKDKRTLKSVVGSYAFGEKFEYKISRSSNTRFTAQCSQRSCGWVLRAWKSNRGSYWHVKVFVNEHTCERNDNYNFEFKRVSAAVIGDLYASKCRDPGRIVRTKDIVFEMRDQHGIHLSYNKAYRSKEHALSQVFGDPWESFQRLPSFFYVLEQANPGTMTKIKTDSKNRLKYAFMAIGASIEGFNSVIRPVICIDATHLKARTRGVLLVAVCKDGNGMIYPLAFGFANSECTKSWTWFLKKLRKGIQNPDRVMLVSDRHNGIFNAMEAIFPDAAHGICVFHLAQNLKRFCKQRDDVMWLYYCAAYAYRVEDFDRFMGELKETCPKVYDELLAVGVEKFSRVHSPRKRTSFMTTNIAESMNSCLVPLRKLPITAMAECIRDLLQRWFYDRRTNAREMSTYLTTFADEHIKDLTDTANKSEIHPINFNTFKVHDKWIPRIIDLDKSSCSCRQWDLDELPCSHAMAVARYASRSFKYVHLSVVVYFSNFNLCLLVFYGLGSKVYQSTQWLLTVTQQDILNMLMECL